MRRLLYLPGLFASLLLAGCHSHYIQATVTNNGTAAVSVIEVEYPHASFGTQQLLPSKTFPYRFKLLGSGPVKIDFVDAKNIEHKQTGPWLNEGQEGRLGIALGDDGHAEFHTDLKP